MASVPVSSGPIKFSDIQSVMGGSGAISMSQYQQLATTYYARGVAGVGANTVSVGQFSGKSKALVSGLQTRVFHRNYRFSAGGGGAAGSGNYAGGGGAGGVSIVSSAAGGTAQTPSSASTAASGTTGGGAGSGFGAGGGGTGCVKARYIIYQYAVGNGGGGRCLNLGGCYAYNTYGGANIITSGMTVTALDNLNTTYYPNSALVDADENTFCHSSCGSEYPWFKIDLGSEQMIHRVELVNRVDCCRGRIAGLQCVLQDAGGNNTYVSSAITRKNGSTTYVDIPVGDPADGWLYYTFWPGVNTTGYGSDTRPYSTVPYGGGQGASGFAYIQIGGTDYFTTTSTTYTFTSSGTATVFLMGGGGGGGIYAGANSRGGGGGGAGYLMTSFVSVTSGNTATITIGGGGAPGASGGNTSVVINGATYATGGGQHGDANQYGGAGSSSGGTGGSGGGVTAGSSSGNTQANTSSQGTVAHAAYIRNNGGYFADDPTWFDTRTENYTPNLSTDFSTINTITGGLIPTDSSWELYSVELFGYFYAPTAGSYTFYTSSDDGSFLWLGSTALSGYTTANALVNNGGLHGTQEVSGSITLSADTYYPIRIHMGEQYYGDALTISFAGPSITKTTNWSGYAFYGLGANSSFPGANARLIKAAKDTTIDKPYYVNAGGTATLTYCLMDNKWNGGGWMMLMKATQGTTFNYNSTYWTDNTTTLNTGSTDRTDADAKFATMNTMNIRDVLALWPDVGYTGGSIAQTDSWSWLVNYYFYGDARTTAITGFGSNARNATDSTLNTSNPNSYSGFSSNIWSTQVGAYRHVMGNTANYPAGNPGMSVRWGFVWNNEADFGTPDVLGGIGMASLWGTNYAAGSNQSAGDMFGCCGGTTGLNRKMRVEMYGR